VSKYIDEQALLQAKGLAYPEYLESPIQCGYFEIGDRIKIMNNYLYKVGIKTFSSMPYTDFKVVEITQNHYRVVSIQTLVVSESDIIPNKGTFLIPRHQNLLA
jgi:hypothetical protein